MSESLPVCHVITKLELGGAQENTLYTVTHLRPPFRADLVCGLGGMLDDEARDQLGSSLHVARHLVRPIRPLHDLWALFELVGHFRRLRPVIVHTHSSKAGILGRLAARIAGVPIVVHTVHGFGFNDRQPALSRGLLRALESLAAGLTTHVVAVSRADRERGIARGILDPRRSSVIRSGFPIARFEAAGREPKAAARARLRREIGAPEDAPVVGLVACLKPQKAPGTFVEVAARISARVPAARFVLAGDGALREATQARIVQLGLEGRVHLLGWRRDVPQILAGLDVFLLTSLWEGLPKVVPQAIAVGVPVVATSVDGVRDILIDGVNGFACEADDVTALADRTVRLLGDAPLRQAMAERARSVLPQFDIDAMVRSQEALYATLLGEAGREDPSKLQALPGQ